MHNATILGSSLSILLVACAAEGVPGDAPPSAATSLLVAASPESEAALGIVAWELGYADGSVSIRGVDEDHVAFGGVTIAADETVTTIHAGETAILAFAASGEIFANTVSGDNAARAWLAGVERDIRPTDVVGYGFFEWAARCGASTAGAAIACARTALTCSTGELASCGSTAAPCAVSAVEAIRCSWGYWRDHVATESDDTTAPSANESGPEADAD